MFSIIKDKTNNTKRNEKKMTFLKIFKKGDPFFYSKKKISIQKSPKQTTV